MFNYSLKIRDGIKARQGMAERWGLNPKLA